MRNDLKMDYKETLMGSGIEQVCAELGLDFYEVFLPGIQNNEASQYEGYSWEARHNSMPGLKAAVVIHAAPPLPKVDNYPWEEWYLFNGQVYHAILYTTRKERNDGFRVPRKANSFSPIIWVRSNKISRIKQQWLFLFS